LAKLTVKPGHKHGLKTKLEFAKTAESPNTLYVPTYTSICQLA